MYAFEQRGEFLALSMWPFSAFASCEIVSNRVRSKFQGSQIQASRARELTSNGSHSILELKRKPDPALGDVITPTHLP
jgi:hypothetical protein